MDADGEAYWVEVETQSLPEGFAFTPTYDPDGGTLNRSTVTLFDVTPNNRDQDFSYPPAARLLYSVGDTMWFDVNSSGGDQSTQGAEPGLPAVRVSLYDAGNALVATTFTDGAGNYLFTGLPAGTYTVAVDTGTLPAYVRVVPTYELDGGADSRATVSIGAGNPHPRTLDFSYPPAAQGVIGDTIWFDLNNSGGDQSTQGAEPGIEGVVIQLLVNGQVVQTTATDENGHYAFGNLPLDTIYQVRVAASNFTPGGVLEGFYNTYDANGGNDSLGPQITLTMASPVNLDQDFSYYGSGPGGTGPVGRVGNLVWLDSNADGVWDGVDGSDDVLGTEDDEPPIGSVSMDLYRDLNGNGQVDAGEPRLAVAATANAIDANAYGPDGNYIFLGLPAGDYVVDVVDQAGVLAGYWHSLGTTGVNNHSQLDPYAVSIATGGENLTADFGYYVRPAAVGNLVWLDGNENGLQDAGEPGFDGAAITLVITYPDGTQTRMQTVTGDDPSTLGVEKGWYSFGNLLLDEDQRQGSGSGTPAANQPAFVISLAMPAGYYATDVHAAGSTPMNDSDDHSGVAAMPTQGRVDVTQKTDPASESNPIASYDFGLIDTPLAIALASFGATAMSDHILVAWETVSELDNTGFNLWRGTSEAGPYIQLNETLIPAQAPGSTLGFIYTFEDFDVAPGETYWYTLEDLDVSGVTTRHGPVSAVLQTPTAVTLMNLNTDEIPSSSVLARLALALAALLAGLSWRNAMRAQ